MKKINYTIVHQFIACIIILFSYILLYLIYKPTINYFISINSSKYYNSIYHSENKDYLILSLNKDYGTQNNIITDVYPDENNIYTFKFKSCNNYKSSKKNKKLNIPKESNQIASEKMAPHLAKTITNTISDNIFLDYFGLLSIIIAIFEYFSNKKRDNILKGNKILIKKCILKYIIICFLTLIFSLGFLLLNTWFFSFSWNIGINLRYALNFIMLLFTVYGLVRNINSFL